MSCAREPEARAVRVYAANGWGAVDEDAAAGKLFLYLILQILPNCGTCAMFPSKRMPGASCTRPHDVHALCHTHTDTLEEQIKGIVALIDNPAREVLHGATIDHCNCQVQKYGDYEPSSCSTTPPSF